MTAILEVNTATPPPQSPEIEMAVLGAIMLEPRDAWSIAARMLRSEDFYIDGHAVIFDVMTDMHTKGMLQDSLGVIEELRSRDLLAKIGGSGVIMAMLNQVPTAANLKHHCKMLVEKPALRRAIRGMLATLEAAYQQDQPVGDILDACADIPRLVRERTGIGVESEARGHVQDVSTAISDMVEHQRRIIDGELPPQTYIPTGLHGLNDQLGGGLMPGDSVHMLARPGTGKSTLALFMAAWAALAGHKVGYIQLDMTRERFLPYVARGLGGLNGQTFRIGDLRQPESSPQGRARLQEIQLTGERWKGSLYVVLDKNGGMDRSMRAVLEYARILRELGCEWLIVDQVECVNGWGGKDRSNYADIVNGLHFGIARELGVTYTGLGQINREGARRPTPMDAQETDSWHKRPDVMLLLHDEQTARCFDRQAPGFVWEMRPDGSRYMRSPKPDDAPSMVNLKPDAQRSVELCIAKSRASASGEWLAFDMDFTQGRPR